MHNVRVVDKDNDNKAFIVNVYKDYYGFVKRTMIRITGVHSDIDDLVNDCFLKLIEKTSTIRVLGQGRLTAYIRYTARSVAINYIKHQKVVKKHVDIAVDTELSEFSAGKYTDIDDRLIRKHEIELLKKAILRLPEKKKNILYFKYLLDMSDKQISEVYSISPDSVRTYLSRARKDAKRLMFEEVDCEG